MPNKEMNNRECKRILERMIKDGEFSPKEFNEEIEAMHHAIKTLDDVMSADKEFIYYARLPGIATIKRKRGYTGF